MIQETKKAHEFAQNKRDNCELFCAGFVLAASAAGAVFNNNAETYVATSVISLFAVDAMARCLSKPHHK